MITREHRFDRLFEIAKEGFVAQHPARIDDLELIKRIMWEMFFKLEKVDTFKACQILVWLMQVQPYISQYYEASKHIMRKVAEENDHAIPPDAKRLFAEQINATTISLPSNHASPLSHPNEVAQLILDAANKLTG